MILYTEVILFLITGFISGSDGQVYGYTVHESNYDCTGQSNGVVEIGCDGYVECQNQHQVKHICPSNQVLNRETLTCVPTTSGNFACSESEFDRCTNLTDGRYADIEEHCTSYFTCHGSVFFGHNYCPAGVIFNQNLGICDWPNNVLFPCGTKPV